MDDKELEKHFQNFIESIKNKDTKKYPKERPLSVIGDRLPFHEIPELQDKDFKN